MKSNGINATPNPSGTAPVNVPRVIAWEVTRRCPLACKHCRGGATDQAYENELTTEECLNILAAIAAFARPMIIWTGGEPMFRPDILTLVQTATRLGIRSVMAPCGTQVTPEALQALKDAGVMACSFSLDGATEAEHDAFRGVAGAYRTITRAMEVANGIGMPFQINCTVSKLNRSSLPAIRETAIARGAKALDLFFLVPVGRGSALRDLALSPEESEAVLRWAFEMDRQGPIRIRETCSPQAVRARNLRDAWGAVASSSSPIPAFSSPAVFSMSAAATYARPVTTSRRSTRPPPSSTTSVSPTATAARAVVAPSARAAAAAAPAPTRPLATTWPANRPAP